MKHKMVRTIPIAIGITCIFALLVFIAFAPSGRASPTLTPPLDKDNVIGVWEGHVMGREEVAVLQIESTGSAILILASPTRDTYYKSEMSYYLYNGYIHIDFIQNYKAIVSGLLGVREPFSRTEAMRIEVEEVNSGGTIYSGSYLMFRNDPNFENYYDRLLKELHFARSLLNKKHFK